MTNARVETVKTALNSIYHYKGAVLALFPHLSHEAQANYYIHAEVYCTYELTWHPQAKSGTSVQLRLRVYVDIFRRLHLPLFHIP